MSNVTVVATVEPSTGPTDPPRVKLDITDTGTPTRFAVNVFRIDPDGRSQQVRGLTGGAVSLTTSGSDRIGSVYDYEAPFGQPVWYSTTESPENLSASVTVNEPDPWLIHPGVPELSREVEFRVDSFAVEEYPIQQGVHYPMGRETPIIVTDGSLKSPQSSFTIGVDTLAELADVRSLLRDASALYLNIPPALQLGVDSCYIGITGIRISRPSNIGSDPHRDVTVSYSVVSRPAGGSQSERTLTDLLVFPTLNALKSSYASLNDLLAGP